MQTGKLPPEALAKLIFPNLGVTRSDVLVHSRFGEDSAVIDFGDEVAVISTDPITGAAQNLGWIGVHVACNDLASMGARPVGILVTMLLPPSESLETAAIIMRDVDRAAKELGIEVLGGHSECTSTVTSAVLSLTAVGRARKTAYVTSGGARPGDTLLLTKSAGLEGTAILATDRHEWLAGRVGETVLDTAEQFISEISVVRDGLAAAPAATAMHDATEGGVLGAIYELAAASGAGVEVWVDQIPVRSETRKICAAFGIDPLRLVSSGSLVITGPDGYGIRQALANVGVEAAVVGMITASGMVMVSDGTTSELRPPQGDELWVALESSR